MYSAWRGKIAGNAERLIDSIDIRLLFLPNPCPIPCFSLPHPYSSVEAMRHRIPIFRPVYKSTARVFASVTVSVEPGHPLPLKLSSRHI